MHFEEVGFFFYLCSMDFSDRIFSIQGQEAFEMLAVDLANFQLLHGEVYREFCHLLGCKEITHYDEIPFLPISFFIAILLSLNKLLQNNEITILKNCGLSNLKIAQPIIFFGLILTLFTYFLSFYLMPLANKQLRISRHNIQENYTNISFTPQTFENLHQITIYTKNRDEKNNLYGILINDQRQKDCHSFQRR